MMNKKEVDENTDNYDLGSIIKFRKKATQELKAFKRMFTKKEKRVHEYWNNKQENVNYENR